MLFPDYQESGVVYHIISLMDLKKALTEGIRFDDKATYRTKYNGFHQLIDQHRPKGIPEWVIRNKAIFASLNYPKTHYFHSHTALLAIKIDPKKCWVANENCANQIYEPFILQNLEIFKSCADYLAQEGSRMIEKYWQTSLSFYDNLEKRYDKKARYDAEVLVLHDIMPEDIDLRYIISDHRMMDVTAWREKFCRLE